MTLSAFTKSTFSHRLVHPAETSPRTQFTSDPSHSQTTQETLESQRERKEPKTFLTQTFPFIPQIIFHCSCSC
ncbi:hypothetical protein CEXT_434191 [Caerostris extrusa]|uniref:Uncharacterized protein n=1 Tax=Caerostris extrusa TaxID=172846 RepID=A0AAV4Y9K1_CAEEX|nr:hypothetical protein CEXT_434191 [Caerostris extrusa]